MNKKTLAYIEGVFEVLILLNEDDHGREFYLTELELNNKTVEDQLNSLLGNEYQNTLNIVTDFKSQIEEIYNRFCQNFIFKIGRLKNQNPTENEIEEISKKLNSEFIKKLFVNSLNGFIQNSSKIVEVKFEENYNYGLPNKGYLIYKEQKCFFLHFAIKG